MGLWEGGDSEGEVGSLRALCDAFVGGLAGVTPEVVLAGRFGGQNSVTSTSIVKVS
jgi:hypothetical protein